MPLLSATVQRIAVNYLLWGETGGTEDRPLSDRTMLHVRNETNLQIKPLEGESESNEAAHFHHAVF